MCRLLSIHSKKEFDITPHLKIFAELSKNSKEYQGHGWGLAYLKGGSWKHYKNIKPIWEDNLNQFPKTTLLIAHARSAFEDKDIKIENNMPFYDKNYIFIFNGELRGVRIKEDGRIGAEKIFNFIKRFDKNDTEKALIKGIDQLKKRTRKYKAINIIMTDKNKLFVSNNYTEQPNYFQMYYKQTKDQIIICSDPYPEKSWKKITNNSVKVF
jgi:predicted glutamine amidotransferase